MMRDLDAARAKAEATFRKPEATTRAGPAAEVERDLRERTERLREARLAKEAMERKGKEIRAARRRGS